MSFFNSEIATSNLNINSNYICNDSTNSHLEFHTLSGSIKLNPNNGQIKMYNNLHMQSGNDIKTILTSDGKIGIGTTNPHCAIQITSDGTSTTYGSTSGGYYFGYGGQESNASRNSSTTSVRLDVNGHARISSGTLVNSDERIKNNFTALLDNNCLNKLKQIIPYSYNYIDIIERGDTLVYGFKAQQIKDIIPGVVNDTNTDYLPNIFKMCNLVFENNANITNIITIDNIDNYDLNSNNKLKIYIESDNNSYIITTITNINNNNVSVDYQFTNNLTQIFVYGKEVKDFHILNYNRIIPVCVSAIQEIDKSVVSHFTGSHSSFPTDETIDYSTKIGQIVVSTGNYKINHNGTEYTGQNAIMIDHATPQFELSNADNQKSVIGIISRVNDDTSILINTSGEGSIWVCSYGGNLENGDYLASCVIEGYGSKQNDDLKHNYTVAKITCNVDFTGDLSGFENSSISYNGIEYKAALVGCIYQIG